MESRDIRDLLEAVRDGNLGIDGAMDKLRLLPFEDVGYAKIDHHRELRTGSPEVIYCAGKTGEQVLGIIERMLKAGGRSILATRADAHIASLVRERYENAHYHELARIVRIENGEPAERVGCVLVLTAGTSDIPVAEEAALTAEAMGSRVERVYDVGVAGIHRLLAQIPAMRRANAIVAVAGMEGALASVVAGLADKPVIAVPTSVGYGANLGGISALLTMINACAGGIAVVNIDNGFGGGLMASMINRQSAGVSEASR